MRRVADDVQKLFAYFLGMLWERKEKEEAKQSGNNNAPLEPHVAHFWFSVKKAKNKQLHGSGWV